MCSITRVVDLGTLYNANGSAMVTVQLDTSSRARAFRGPVQVEARLATTSFGAVDNASPALLAEWPAAERAPQFGESLYKQ